MRRKRIMKKVFVSQPMRGLSADAIKTNRAAIEEYVRREYGEVEFIDSYFPDFNGNAVSFLGKAIQKLSEADVAVFGAGWEAARGCKMENYVCKAYDIPVIELSE
jgi:hypothetical protein